MRGLKIFLLFYTNFWFSALLITPFGCYLSWQSQSVSYTLVFSIVKVFTSVLLGALYGTFRGGQLYFYHNLGFSTVKLYGTTLAADMALWTIGVVAIGLI
jgi:hypothetical protein